MEGSSRVSQPDIQTKKIEESFIFYCSTT